MGAVGEAGQAAAQQADQHGEHRSLLLFVSRQASGGDGTASRGPGAPAPMPTPVQHGSSAASREELLPQPVAANGLGASRSSSSLPGAGAATAVPHPAAAAPPLLDEIEEGAEGHEAAPHVPLLGNRASKPPSSSPHLHNVAAAAGHGAATRGTVGFFATPGGTASHNGDTISKSYPLAAADSRGGSIGKGIARLEVEGGEDEEGHYSSAGNPVRR